MDNDQSYLETTADASFKDEITDDMISNSFSNATSKVIGEYLRSWLYFSWHARFLAFYLKSAL